MANVKQCDKCGAFDTNANAVERESVVTVLHPDNDSLLSIYVPIPRGWNGRDLCRECVAQIIRERFSDICAMLAPYQPARVAGFVQVALPPVDSSPLSEAERQALSILSKRLLETA